MGAGAVAVIVAKEKHIVEAFRRARAVSTESAVTPGAIGVADQMAFRRLREHAVLREARPGSFYLDEPSWEALRTMRRRLGLALLAVAVLAAVVVWLRSR